MEELSAIAQAVRVATGKDGRSRTMRDGDRVRVSITNAVKRCIWSIGQQRAEIAEYLTRTITTGSMMIFRPLADEWWETGSQRRAA